MVGTMAATSATAVSAPSWNALLEAVGGHQDRAAFCQLFEHFGPRLKAYLLRTGSDPTSAEEIAQEVMLMVWRKASTFDARQASASTWIFTIARNKRIDAYRRERHVEADSEYQLAQLPDTSTPVDHAIGSEQEGARLREAIRQLPPEQGELLRMAYYEDKPHSVIAEERGLPLGTVKSRLRLAHARLRKVAEQWM